jgi:glycosyltransferase involved in cell wall biosynthesis
MKLNIQKSVVVITPTIGQVSLIDAAKSVQNQTYGNITHLIVADGQKEYLNKMLTVNFPSKENTVITSTPWNTGSGGFYGHRIYAAYPHLVDHDYVVFLDEDNWFEPDHIKSLVETIEKRGWDWGHSLRKIYTKTGEFVLDDGQFIGPWTMLQQNI